MSTIVEVSISGSPVSLDADTVDDVLAMGGWRVCTDKRGRPYVRRSAGSGRVQYLHRVIAQAVAGQVIDHINGNSLDNRRANLRVCSFAQNAWNRGPKSRNRTGYKGVVRNGRQWAARIMANGQLVVCYGFISPEEAALAYNELARQYHGEFAYQNAVA
jgi:hypothetical protein